LEKINTVYSRRGFGGERRARDKLDRCRDRAKDIEKQADWTGIAIV